MNDTANSPYASPSADLIEKNKNNKNILEFKRFSAWGVFGLSVITIGIYPVYWLWTRAETINTLHDRKITKAWLIALVATTILSTILGFMGDNTVILSASLILSLAYLVTYIVVLFKARNNLQDIMNAGGGETYKLNPVLTFFANVIYLQYKTNECIDHNTTSSQEAA